MIEFLKGKKSYIVGFLLAALALARAMNYINDQVYQAILALLAALGISAIRAAITNPPAAG